MPFIRLSDNYIDHPKFTALSDGAFRLWHQALAFCRRHETDGVIPKTTMRLFTSYSPKRVAELVAPWQPGAHPLLASVGDGYVVHDYLFWNLSKVEARLEKTGSTQRMRTMRQRRYTARDGPRDAECYGVTPPSQPAVTTGNVPDRDTDRIGSEEKKESSREEIGQRAQSLLEHYVGWYQRERHGALLRLLHNSLEFDEACTLVALWDDGRLEKLARIILTTDDPFITSTDRSFKIFAMKATWADDRLRQWEASHPEPAA